VKCPSSSSAGQLSRLEYIEKLSLLWICIDNSQMTIHSAEHSKLDRLRIATPCPIGWDQMTGDNRIRFCGHCQLNVYNISELSRIEAEKLIASSEGRLCARLFRRADGTILTKDCPVGLRALRRRVAKRTATVFAAMLSLSAAVFGQQSSSKHGKTSCTPQTRITRTNATPDHAAKALAGTVLDQYGAVVPGADVQLIKADTKEIQHASTNDEGRFEFESLAVGKYSVTITAANFKKGELKDLVVEKDKLINLDMILEFSGGLVTVGLLVGEPSLIDTPPGTTIITEQMIRNLPHQK
jgi:hypothetical protein